MFYMSPPSFLFMKKRILSFFLMIALMAGILPTIVNAVSYEIALSRTETSCSNYSTYNGSLITPEGVKIPNMTVSPIYVLTVESNDVVNFVVSAPKVIVAYNTGLSGNTSTNFLKDVEDFLAWENNSHYKTDEDTLESLLNLTFGEEASEENPFLSGCEAYYFMGVTADYKAENVTGYGILIQVTAASVKDTDKTELNGLIAKVTGENEENWHRSGDRYNGRTTSTDGFWADMQPALETAQAVAADNTVEQATVTSAAENLKACIDRLIPASQANTTALYEKLNTYWAWNWNGTSITTSRGGEAVSAENTTAMTWEPYAAAREEGTALLESFFDDDGNATEANTAAMQDKVDELAAVNPYLLVSKEAYAQRYDYYTQNRDAAFTLLEQYDPASLTASDYTGESWEAYTAAYDALKEAMAYTVVGGTKEDYLMLGRFSGYGYQEADGTVWYGGLSLIEQLQAARKQLASAVDITVSFSYVDHFAAKFPQLRTEDGMDVYRDEALELKGGAATLKDAIDASGISFHQKDLGTSVEIPGTWLNYSDSSPLIAVYINEESYGLTYCLSDDINKNPIQLHDGDEVRIARICSLGQEIEVSTGYDSSRVEESITSSEEHFRQSYALIDMTPPSGTVKVGDKAAFSAAVTGAYAGGNLGRELDAEGLTLFISAPSQEEALAAPTIQTGYATDAEGALEYVFAEPGWYTVALLNVNDNIPTFTDIFNSVTLGEYYSLYAGDFATLYVAPADDEAALIAQYRDEYRAAAAAYFAPFHDYDFEAGYYEGTFRAQYDALLAHLESAETFKELKETYDSDFAALQACGAAAIDHAALIAGLRADLELVPADPAAMDESYADLLEGIQTVYAGLNAYQRTLLTGQETGLLEQLAAMDAENLQKLASVQVNVTVDGKLSTTGGTGGAAAYGWPNLTWSMHPQPDGTVPTPVWATIGGTTEGATLTAKAGDHLFIRRYMPNTTDSAYWMMWSLDGGASWNASKEQTLDVYDGYYLAEYVIPQDAEDGSSLNIVLKMFSKTEYENYLAGQDADGLDAAKAAASAAIQTTYDGYDLSKYDEAGKAALKTALDSGLKAIDEATTTSAVAEARKAALAAMASVQTIDGGTSTGAEVSFDSGSTVGKVRVIIENTTYAEGPFYGEGSIADGWYDLGENDTMMTMVLKVLQSKGYYWNGTKDFGDETAADYSITYIASIGKGDETLAEFTGGQKSGWMGTLNDWFTNEGFQAFSYKNGQLENNDEIHIMYTCSYGEDINGTWRDNVNTTLQSMEVSPGTLVNGFASDTTEYMLVIDKERVSVTVYPVPTNKNYQYRIFLNDYNKDSAQYKRTETISVTSGDVIYVGVGEEGWPTMNSGSDPTRYTIRVYTLEDAMQNLPAASSVTLNNYGAYDETVQKMEDLISQQGWSGDRSQLDALKERVAFYAEIVNVKNLLNKVPAADQLDRGDIDAVEAAHEAYEDLSEEQRLYITLSDVAKYNAAVEWLEKQGVHTPGSIAGNENPPEELLSDLPFSDVKEEHWFHEAVQYVYGSGLMNGTSATLFSPNGTMNRAMLVTILYRMEGEPDVAAANAFTDVPADAWYADAVAWASAHGIVDGVGESRFAPMRSITREQMAVMLYRYAQYKGCTLEAGADLSRYADAGDISAWALEALQWANAAGLITGRTASAIVPGGTATRAEAATILMRFLEDVMAEP